MSVSCLCRRALWCVIVVVVFAGCDEDEWRTVELGLVSLAATDSVAEGEDLEVQFGYYATGEDQYSFHRWEVVDPTTFRLRVFDRFPTSDGLIGAPAFLTSSTVVLESPPAQSFRILAGDVSVRVQGGADPRPASRLTVILTQDGEPVEGVNLQLGNPAATNGAGPVPLPPTDSQGITEALDACPSGGSRFWIESSDQTFLAPATARWPSSCEVPLRLAITGRSLEAPSEP